MSALTKIQKEIITDLANDPDAYIAKSKFTGTTHDGVFFVLHRGDGSTRSFKKMTWIRISHLMEQTGDVDAIKGWSERKYQLTPSLRERFATLPKQGELMESDRSE